MLLENSAEQKKFNMEKCNKKSVQHKKVQLEKSAIWKKCNMEKVQHEMSATWSKTKKSATWKKCNT